MNYSQAIGIVTGLSVAGVRTVIGFMPDQVNTAELPLMFPLFPHGENAVVALTGAKGLEQVRVNVWVLVEPTTQSRAPRRFAECVAVLDGLQVAMAGNPAIDAYSLRMELIRVEATTYWGVVAEIEVS